MFNGMLCIYIDYDLLYLHDKHYFVGVEEYSTKTNIHQHITKNIKWVPQRRRKNMIQEQGVIDQVSSFI